MKIKVEKWLIDKEVSYKILSIEQCKCGELTRSKNIVINDSYCENGDCSEDNEYSVKFIRKEYAYDGYCSSYYERIKYCFKCGEKIEIEIVNEVDKTDEYNNLQKERKILWKEHNNTDSISRQYHLKQQVQALDRNINNMATSDDFEKEDK